MSCSPVPGASAWIAVTSSAMWAIADLGYVHYRPQGPPGVERNAGERQKAAQDLATSPRQPLDLSSAGSARRRSAGYRSPETATSSPEAALASSVAHEGNWATAGRVGTTALASSRSSASLTGRGSWP